MKKIHFQENLFEMDFQRYATFLLSPEVILEMYGDRTTYPAMGSIMQAGGGITYYSPDGHWELSGGVYAANYSIATPSSLAHIRPHEDEMDNDTYTPTCNKLMEKEIMQRNFFR